MPVQGVPTPLKTAFAAARETRDMAGVLPVFLRSPLFVVGVAQGDRLDPYISRPPGGERMAVTVAESRETLARVPAHLVHATDAAGLLGRMVGAWDIVVCYPDGGDLLQAEYLPDLRAMLRGEDAAPDRRPPPRPTP